MCEFFHLFFSLMSSRLGLEALSQYISWEFDWNSIESTDRSPSFRNFICTMRITQQLCELGIILETMEAICAFHQMFPTLCLLGTSRNVSLGLPWGREGPCDYYSMSVNGTECMSLPCWCVPSRAFFLSRMATSDIQDVAIPPPWVPQSAELTCWPATDTKC